MRYFKFIIITITCFCLYVNIGASQIDIEYSGEPPDTYIRSSINNISLKMSKDAVSDTLNTILTSSGYLNNRITISDSLIMIDAGVLFNIGSINLEIIKSDGEKISNQIDQYANIPASKVNIEFVKSEILNEFQEAGYYFASMSVLGVIHDDNLLKLKLRILTGPVVKLERIRFKGLSKTSPDFVKKLSGLREGYFLNTSVIENAIEKISNSGFLTFDSIPSVIPNQNYDGVELIFNLSELKSNQIEFSGGYLPGRGDQDGEFVGFLNFKSKNLFGGGRRINLLLDRKDRLSSRIEFGYLQPLFIPDLLEISGRFLQIDNNDFYHLFSVEGAIAIQTRKHTKLSGAVSWAKTEPQNYSQAPSRVWAGEFSYRYSNFEYKLNPLSGTSLGGSLSYIRRVSWPDSVAMGVINNDSKISVSADNLMPLNDYFVIRVNLESQIYITSRDVIDFSEQFKLGGFGSLRGYRQEQFAGRRVALGQLEFRYRPSAAASFYIFSDLGYIYSRNLISGRELKSKELFKPGFGLGIFTAKASTSITFETGWGEGDNIEQGKLHFGLITKF